jgi:hypothetical protein
MVSAVRPPRPGAAAVSDLLSGSHPSPAERAFIHASTVSRRKPLFRSVMRTGRARVPAWTIRHSVVLETPIISTTWRGALWTAPSTSVHLMSIHRVVVQAERHRRHRECGRKSLPLSAAPSTWSPVSEMKPFCCSPPESGSDRGSGRSSLCARCPATTVDVHHERDGCAALLPRATLEPTVGREPCRPQLIRCVSGAGRGLQMPSSARRYRIRLT